MSHSNSQPEIWVAKNATLPDVCIGCGMYTDRRLTRKFTTKVDTTVDADSGTASAGLGCFLILLGPLGMLISLLMNMQKKNADGRTKIRTVTLKAKIKIPVCPMCESENKGMPIDADTGSQEFAFESNSNFIRQYEQLNR